jgi:hypothetical protein
MNKEEILALYPYGFDIPEDLYFANAFQRFILKVFDILKYEHCFIFFKSRCNFTHEFLNNQDLDYDENIQENLANTKILVIYNFDEHKQSVFFKTELDATLVKLLS